MGLLHCLLCLQLQKPDQFWTNFELRFFCGGSQPYKFRWATGERHGMTLLVSSAYMSGWMDWVLGRLSLDQAFANTRSRSCETIGVREGR